MTWTIKPTHEHPVNFSAKNQGATVNVMGGLAELKRVS